MSQLNQLSKSIKDMSFSSVLKDFTRQQNVGCFRPILSVVDQARVGAYVHRFADGIDMRYQAPFAIPEHPIIYVDDVSAFHAFSLPLLSQSMNTILHDYVTRSRLEVK